MPGGLLLANHASASASAFPKACACSRNCASPVWMPRPASVATISSVGVSSSPLYHQSGFSVRLRAACRASLAFCFALFRFPRPATRLLPLFTHPPKTGEGGIPPEVSREANRKATAPPPPPPPRPPPPRPNLTPNLYPHSKREYPVHAPRAWPAGDAASRPHRSG